MTEYSQRKTKERQEKRPTEVQRHPKERERGRSEVRDEKKGLSHERTQLPMYISTTRSEKRRESSTRAPWFAKSRWPVNHWSLPDNI